MAKPDHDASGGAPISTLPIHRKLTEGIGYFFALLPDEQARAEIAANGERFRKAHRVNGTPVAAERLHITLVEMGRSEGPAEPTEEALLAAAGEVRGQIFTMRLDSAMRFSARKGVYPFVLCADTQSTASALQLRKAVADAQRRHGLQVPGVSSFLPHVTLLHGHVVDAIQESVPALQWQVTEFVLIRSFFGESTHEVVGRWPLEAVAKPAIPDYFQELAELEAARTKPGES